MKFCSTDKISETVSLIRNKKVYFIGRNKFIIKKIECWPFFKQDPNMDVANHLSKGSTKFTTNVGTRSTDRNAWDCLSRITKTARPLPGTIFPKTEGADCWAGRAQRWDCVSANALLWPVRTISHKTLAMPRQKTLVQAIEENICTGK